MAPDARPAPLEGIDTLDWALHRHAYGVATDVPDLLRTLATADVRSRRRALAELANRVNHLGRCTPVAEHVVPWLVALVGAAHVRGRAPLLVMLGNLAAGGDHAGRLRGEVCAYDGPLEARVHDRVVAGGALYVAALDDRRDDVRVAALFVLAFVPSCAHAARPAIIARLSDEHARVRSSARLSLAMLGEVSECPPAGATWVEQFSNAAAAAMLGEPTIEHTRVLVGALATRARKRLPWNDGDLAGLARALLETIGAPMLIGALADIPDGDAERRLAVYDLAELMLRVSLGPHARTRAPGELTAYQRAIVAALAARCDVWKVSRTARAARAVGIPDSRDAVAAWLSGSRHDG